MVPPQRRLNYAVLALSASLAACATPPESIPAATIPSSTYAGYSCDRLLDLRLRIEDALQVAMMQQKSASNTDAWGVFLVGMPVASLSGADIAPRVASLKGQRATVTDLISTQRCITS
jgi:hypothetical protein